MDGARHPDLPPGLHWVSGPARTRPGDIVALMVIRNEELRLGASLRHLRRLGVDRMIVVDNGSTDGSRTVALAAGADVVDAPASYAGADFGLDWTNAILHTEARGHWVLVVDADEFLVYPGCGEAPLRALCAHLDALGSEALETLTVDCFPPGPLAECAYRPGEDIMAAAPLFEPPEPHHEAIADFPYRLSYGGVRQRLFFPETDHRRAGRWLHERAWNLGLRLPPLRRLDWFRRLAPRRPPTISKLPLLRWREGAMLYGSTHRMAPLKLAPNQPSGALLHYKFLQDFHARALDAVARNAHFDDSREYRRYLARLEREPRLGLAGPRSIAYAGPGQLLELGIMQDTPGWRAARWRLRSRAAAGAQKDATA